MPCTSLPTTDIQTPILGSPQMVVQVFVNPKNSSHHTTSTAPMSPCSMNEKETQLPSCAMDDSSVSSLWGSIALTQDEALTITKPLSKSNQRVKVTNDHLESPTKHPLSKIRKTKSLCSPKSLLSIGQSDNRWGLLDDHCANQNEEWALQLRKPERRRGDSIEDDEWIMLIEGHESPRVPKKVQGTTMRRCSSTVEARQTQPAFTGILDKTICSTLQDKDGNDKVVSRAATSTDKKRPEKASPMNGSENEEEKLRHYLAELYGQAAALAENATIPCERLPSSATTGKTRPLLEPMKKSGRRPRQSNLQDQVTTHLQNTNYTTTSSGSITSKGSLSSYSTGIASIYNASNHSTTMASVFNANLTADQQAKLLALQKTASISSSTSNLSGKGQGTSIELGSSTIRFPMEDTSIPHNHHNDSPLQPLAKSPAGNICASVRSDVSDLSQSEVGTSTTSIDRSGSYSLSSDLSSRSNRKSSREKSQHRHQRHLSPLGQANDAVQSHMRTASKPMPFGYKAKSTVGLFDSKTPPTSNCQLSGQPSPRRGSESSRSQSNSRWTGSAGNELSSNSIHSCLEKAPVKGEQLAAMKALLLGQVPPSSSSKAKKSLVAYTHRSTPFLNEYDATESSPLHLDQKSLAKKNLSSSNMVLPGQGSRWQPTPIPQNGRWDSDIVTSMLPLTGNRLSGRRTAGVLSQSEHGRWSSTNLSALQKQPRSLSTGMESPTKPVRKNVEIPSSRRSRDTVPRTELSPSRWNANSPTAIPDSRNSLRSGITAHPSALEAGPQSSSLVKSKVAERRPGISPKGREKLTQSEHCSKRWGSGNDLVLRRSGSDLVTSLVGCPKSPEAMALSALIMRRDGEKCTSVKMKRDSGSSTRLKPAASLGQLKRSRLSLANMNDSETPPNTGGGMNTTWNSIHDNNTVTSDLHQTQRNMFSSIISGSSHRRPNSPFSSTVREPLPSLSPTTDLDTNLSNYLSHGTKSDNVVKSGANFQVDGKTLTVRNKSDLRQILGASVGGKNLQKSRSSDSVWDRF